MTLTWILTVQYWVSVLLAVYGAALLGASRTYPLHLEPHKVLSFGQDFQCLIPLQMDDAL